MKMKAKFPLNMLNGSLRLVAGVLLIVLTLAGCQKRYGSEFESGDRDGYLTHTVKYPGETLFSISMWYTGVGANWTAIEAANPGLNPNRIRIGDVIRIPRRFTIKSEPLPASAATTGVARRAGTSSATNASGREAAPVSGAQKPSTKPNMEEVTERSLGGTLVVPSAANKVDTLGATSNSSAANALSIATRSPKLETFDDVDEVDATLGQEAGNVSSAARSIGNTALSSGSSGLTQGSTGLTSADAVSSAASSISSVAAGSNTSAVAAAATTGESAEVQKRTKTRDELLQELLKDY